MTRRRAGARRAPGALLLSAVLAVLAGCGATAAAPSGGAPTTTAGPLDFRAPTVDGGTLDAAELAGRPVVLWFWAPWCTVCRAEAPGVAQVAAEHRDEVVFLGVAGHGGPVEAQRFVQETGTGDLEHVLDTDGALWTRFGIVAQPGFVFVDASGATERFSGSLDAAALRGFVEPLAAGAG